MRRLLLAVGMFFVAGIVSAGSVPDDWCDAQSRYTVNEACQGNPVGSVWVNKNGITNSCKWGSADGFTAIMGGTLSGSDWTWFVAGLISCPPSQPSTNPCKANAPQLGNGYRGRVLVSMSFCMPGVPTNDGSGGTVTCKMSFTPSAPPIQNQWGNWNTAGTLTATGDLCGGDQGGWSNPDGSPVGDPAPPSPQVTPPLPAPPQTCGGGSCYDPNKDQYCATSGSTQICVPGSTGRGFGNTGAPTPTPPGTPQGGCSSSGDSTLCVGTPSAPQPPAPPQSPIADPPTSVTNIDHYTQANPQTGVNTPVTAVTYSNPGGVQTTNGQKPGDSGPAPASSTAKPGNGAGGGGDCTSPPVMTGDAALGMIARQTWYTRCAVEANSIKASDFAGADRSLGDQTTSPDVVFQEGGTGSTGGVLDGLDSGGFLGGRSCPGFAPVKGVGGYDIVTDRGVCDIFGQIGTYILAMAYALGAFIIYKGKAS